MGLQATAKLTAVTMMMISLGGAATAAPTIEAGKVYLDTAPILDNGYTLDTWDPELGPYTGSGPAAEVELNAAPAARATPSNLPDAGDKVEYDGGKRTISSSFECRKFNADNGCTLLIDGDVVIYATEEFIIQNDARVRLMDGATLTIFVSKNATIDNGAVLNMDTWDPSRVTFVNTGSRPFRIENDAQVCAVVESPSGGLIIENNADLYGSYGGASLRLENDGGLHVMPGAARIVVRLPEATGLYD